jgi:hypothetical protein
MYTVYYGPTFLSSLPITGLTTCAAALILFRSALRTYIYSVYSGPTFLLSYLLSSLPITAITTCAAALILFRSVFRTYIPSTQAPPSSSPTSSPPSPSQQSPPALLLSYSSSLYTVYLGPTFLLPSLLSSLPITVVTTCAAALILSGLYLEHIYGLLGPHLPPLLPALLPIHHRAHHLSCRSHTIQVCMKNIYSGPTFLLSYLLSSLPITALTT